MDTTHFFAETTSRQICQDAASTDSEEEEVPTVDDWSTTPLSRGWFWKQLSSLRGKKRGLFIILGFVFYDHFM